MSAPTDTELVRRCLAGDEGAWTLLVQRYADVVYAVGRRSGLGALDAGDVVQEVFLALLKGLGRLRQTDRLLGWILQSARREAWRQRRRARAAGRRDEEAARPEAAAGPLPADELASLEDEQHVREAFADISERCRRLLDLLFFRDPVPSYEAVSEELGVPIGSLGPTRRRCLERLKGALEARGFEGPDVSERRPSASGRVDGAPR